MEEAADDPMSSMDLRQGETGSRVRRRLVQATLFPRGKEEEEDEEVIKDEKEEEEEDWCNNISKKKKRKSLEGNTNKSRAQKKVTVNVNEISNKKMDNGHSPVIMKSDFFLKISDRRQQKKQQEDHLCAVSPEANNYSLPPNSADNCKTPQDLKQQASLVLEKQQTKSTTPKKKVINNGAKKSLFKRSPSKTVLDEQTKQFSPNLRSEAKITAEENSRLFAGRPIHPFFSSWKVNKKNQEITEMDNACCSYDGREESTSFNPIHVFETDKDDAISLDWGNWIFSEGSFPNFNPGLGSGSAVFERSVNSLQLDNIPPFCHPSTTTRCQNRISLDQCPDEPNEDSEIDRLDSIQVFSSCQHSDAEWKFKVLQQSSCNLLENSLWTDKYHPRTDAEICGNAESVKFISQWLNLWHDRGSQTCKNSFEVENLVEDVDYNYSQSGADSENSDTEASLKNVLLVKGPVGSGKSAAIYACAEEQGFQIIEVNTSDWRNGALVKQKFGEALESHWLQHKVDNTTYSDMKPPPKSVQGITKGSKPEVVELIQLSDEEDSQQSHHSSCRPIGRGNMDQIKTLILFEDVDSTLSGDHGFLSTIQQLAQTAKRPMILTANKYNPVLPNNLDRLEVVFKMPSLEELNSLGHMVCAAENAQIHAHLMDRVIEYCHRDIRKTIMHLQFWCQGPNSQKGNRPKVAFSPFLFDLEAGHRMMPKLISWGYPSQLSELVAEEITKSLMMMEEERSSLVEIVVEEEMSDRKRHSSRNRRTRLDHIEAKKEEILNLNCSFQVEDELVSRPQSNPEFSDSSSSPVAFARRNVRRRLDAVMSSDSEENIDPVISPDSEENNSISHCALGDTNGEIGVNSDSPLNYFPIESCYPPSEQLSLFDRYKVEQKSSNYSETCISPCVNSMSNLADVSCIPESSSVPETEVIDEIGLFSATVSYSPHVCTEDVDTMRNYLSPSLSTLECEQLCNPILGSYIEVGKSPPHGEAVGDSNIEHGEEVARVYQELDECSRCNIAGTAKTLDMPRSNWSINIVEETWQRLRNCHGDLKQRATPEQKDASHVLRLAFGMSNLISDADLLLVYCQPHIYDMFESSRLLPEKSHSYRWYDDQLQMSTVFSQHGISFYAKEASELESNRACSDRMDLAWEMLSSSTNTMALGKLLSLDKKLTESMETRTPINWSSLQRKKDSSFCNVLHSVVPSRAYLSLQGDAFHEYSASLSQISRSDASHFSERSRERKQRRGRVARHYLSTGTYSLSPEAISLLSQCNIFRKASHQSGRTNVE